MKKHKERVINRLRKLFPGGLWRYDGMSRWIKLPTEGPDLDKPLMEIQGESTYPNECTGTHVVIYRDQDGRQIQELGMDVQSYTP